MVTEDDLVRAIRKVLAGEAPGVAVPIGDDAAVVDTGEGHAVLTADTLVEGVHFEADLTSAHDLGHKAVSVNVSDVAAMGGSPSFGVASLAAPRSVVASWVVELYGGMRQAGEDYAMSVVGGDTVRAEQTVITVAVLGRVAPGRAVTRSGARPGDALVVTGSLGAAAGGLRLAHGPPDRVKEVAGARWARRLMGALTHPLARVGEGEVLAQEGATAMIDVSDGLALDLSRVCEMSGVGARVRLADVPLPGDVVKLSRVLEVDPMDLALHGGEDYELLAALPPDSVESARERMRKRLGTPLTAIGEVTEAGLVAQRPDGSEEPLEPRGWDHFA